jgi:hypothetical protein
MAQRPSVTFEWPVIAGFIILFAGLATVRLVTLYQNGGWNGIWFSAGFGLFCVLGWVWFWASGRKTRRNRRTHD